MAEADDYVLVIDDDPDIRETLSAALETYGYRVQSASGGNEALAWLRSHPRRPSLILLDLMMPELDGVEFRVAQLEDPALASLPTVVLTGAATVDRCGPLAGLDVLRKPVDLATLIRTVRQHRRVD